MYNMFSARLSITIPFILTFTQRLANALPADLASLAVREVPADDITKYTTQFFLDNVQRAPDASSCLFYTAGLSQIAKDFSKEGENSYTTIWDIWSCPLYNDDSTDNDNPLREILDKESPDRLTYFENMSRAMAKLCKGTAQVMTEKVGEIPQTGVWGRIEFPTLKANQNIAAVAAFDVNGENTMTIYEKLLKRALLYSKPQKRQFQTFQRPDCYTSGQLQEKFGDIDW